VRGLDSWRIPFGVTDGLRLKPQLGNQQHEIEETEIGVDKNFKITTIIKLRFKITKITFNRILQTTFKRILQNNYGNTNNNKYTKLS
jgi:hypothetical protein